MPEHDDQSLHVATRILKPTQRMGAPTADDLTLINARFAADDLSADDVFTFPMVISTDAVDSYFTHMDVSTLRNFTEDFNAGQALLDSHVIYQQPIGKSYRAALGPITDRERSDATQQVLVDWYLLRNHVVAGTNTEEYRKGILGGVSNKGSVGFGGPDMRYVCDIDGKGLWESDYYPGQLLKDGRRATFAVVNARAMEGSLVYKNSTPGALVQRVQELITARHVSPDDVTYLETSWQTRFARPARLHRGAAIDKETPVDQVQLRALLQTIQRVGKTLSAATRAKLDAAIGRLSDAAVNVDEAATELATLLADVDGEAEAGRSLKAALGDDANAERIATLKANAQAGAAYRATLIDEAVQARTAARGDGFTKEQADRYRQRLQRLPIEEVTEERDDWAARRQQTFTAGRSIPAHDRFAPTADQPVGGQYVEVE